MDVGVGVFAGKFEGTDGDVMTVVPPSPLRFLSEYFCAETVAANNMKKRRRHPQESDDLFEYGFIMLA